MTIFSVAAQTGAEPPTSRPANRWPRKATNLVREKSIHRLFAFIVDAVVGYERQPKDSFLCLCKQHTHTHTPERSAATKLSHGTRPVEFDEMRLLARWLPLLPLPLIELELFSETRESAAQQQQQQSKPQKPSRASESRQDC